ncbi:MAG: PEPxxWA-CTERM sorting domain-containing protein [Caulobacteraceae bacterium]
MKTLGRSLILAGTLLGAPIAANAQAVGADVGKNLEYQQTGPTTVIPYNGGTNAFIFARSFFANPGDFDGGSMSFPGPASPQAYNGSESGGGFNDVGYFSPYMTQAALDTAFPTGITYALTATNSVSHASQTINVPYLADYYTADIPALTAASFTALQGANPNAGLTLSFNSFTPAANAGFGQGFFSIYDYTTGMGVFAASGFSPSTTSVSFGPHTLTAGDSYTYELIFDDGVTGIDPASGLAYTARSDQRTFGLFSAGPAGVPEPAAWALMLAGFGLAGAGLRRSRRPRDPAVAPVSPLV